MFRLVVLLAIASVAISFPLSSDSSDDACAYDKQRIPQCFSDLMNNPPTAEDWNNLKNSKDYAGAAKLIHQLRGGIKCLLPSSCPYTNIVDSYTEKLDDFFTQIANNQIAECLTALDEVCGESNDFSTTSTLASYNCGRVHLRGVEQCKHIDIAAYDETFAAALDFIITTKTYLEIFVAFHPSIANLYQ